MAEIKIDYKNYTRTKKKKKAFEDFLEGYTYSFIAEKYGLTLNNIRNWASKEKWPAKKQELLNLYTDHLFHRVIEEAEVATENLVGCTSIISSLALKYFTSLKKQCDDNGMYPNHVEMKQCKDWMFMLEKCANIHMKAMPEMGEELSNKLMNELKRSNDDRQSMRLIEDMEGKSRKPKQ